MSDRSESRSSRRRFLKYKLATGATLALAGCNYDTNSNPDVDFGFDPSGQTISGRIKTVDEEGISGATVAVMGVVAKVASLQTPITQPVSNAQARVLAADESANDGRFQLEIAQLDDREVLLTDVAGPVTSIVAQVPGQEHGWFGAKTIDSPEELQSEQKITLRHELLYTSQDELQSTDISIWRTIHTAGSSEAPSEQSLSVELRGRPYHHPLGSSEVDFEPYYRSSIIRGQVGIQFPDDVPDQLLVAYPDADDQWFSARLASPEDNSPAGDNPTKWWESNKTEWKAGDLQGGEEGLTISQIFADTVGRQLLSPLYEFYEQNGFSPQTHEDRMELLLNDEGLILPDATDEILNFLTSVGGTALADAGIAVEAAAWLTNAGLYANDQISIPIDTDDPQYAGNNWRPDDEGPNHYDTVSASWINEGTVGWPPAVVHRVDVEINAEAEVNRHPIVFKSGWISGHWPGTYDVSRASGRLSHGLNIDFAKVGPSDSKTGDPQPPETPTETPSETITGQWPQRLADAQNTGYSPTSGASGSLQNIWSFNADEYYEQFFGAHYAPVTDGRYIYVCTEYGPLVALSPDGSPAWRFSEPRAPNGVEPAGIAVDDERVYMTMQETYTPAVSDRPAVYAVSTDDGSVDWRYRFPELEFGGRSSRLGPPTLADDTLYIFGVASDAEPEGKSPLVALDAESGEIRWRVAVPGVWDFSDYAPVATDDKVLVNTRDNFSAYQRSDGTKLWTFEIKGPSRVVAAQGTALVQGRLSDMEDSGMLAYDLAVAEQSGESAARQWRALTDPAVELDKITVDPVDGTVYATATDSLESDQLHAIDLQDGRRLNSYTHESVGAGGDPIMSPVLTEDIVYFGDPYGTLVGLDRKTGTPRFEVEHGGINYFPIATGTELYTTSSQLRAWKEN